MSVRRVSALKFVFLAVVLASPYIAQGQTRTFGAWTVVMSDDKRDLIAATSVDGDKFLAYRCFGNVGRCMHSIVLDIECEEGESYPLLVNASSSAVAMTCTCSKSAELYELIPDFDQFYSILQNSTGAIGFALPLASGQFKVVRFNLTGVRDAMTLAERAARKADSAEYR
jgi:hypothetical protein